MNHVVIIAEAGVNHNGDMNLAKKLIECAADAGADYVKFQSFKAEKLVSMHAKKAEYQIENTNSDDETQFNMLKKLELSHENHLELMEFCKQKKIKFLSTAFDVDGISYLANLGLNIFKSPSGEVTNFPYLRAMAQTKKPVILSTGMATLQEIENAVVILEKYGCPKSNVTILHCNTEYPTPMDQVNLKAMNSIAEKLGVSIGYSDHTLGIEVPIAAVALGATVIEKHFTLDRNLPGPDHKASLEPGELKAMVIAIRNIEKAISGDGIKKPSTSETKNIIIARKSIHLSKNVKHGDKITEDVLICLRPGDGISPMEWESVVGKSAKTDLQAGEKIKREDLT